MPEPQGFFNFPGIKSIISGDYVLAHGITPGIATIVIAPQASFTPLDGELQITYPGAAIVMPNCRLQTHSFEFDANGLIWRLAIYDQRWRWKFGSITGNYNLRKHIRGQWDDTLDRSTEMTPQNLARLCLRAMGEPDFDVSQLPSGARPEIHWDHDNPAQALASLAELLGCRVVLKIGGKVTVEPVGQGAALVATNSMIQESLSISPPTMPGSMQLVCGPTRYQADFLLEAVGQDVDGRIRPIAQLSYTPAGGWGTTAGVCPPGFPSLSGIPRELAIASVFRWYRIPQKPLGIDGKPLAIPGYPRPITAREQVLPVEDVQVETFIDVGIVNQVQPDDVAVPVTERMPRSKPAAVYGFHRRRSEAEDDKGCIVQPPLAAKAGVNAVPSISHVGPAGKDAALVSPSRYNIDMQMGIVKFHDFEYFLQRPIVPGFVGAPAASDFTAKPSILALRCACLIRNPAGKVPERYVREKVLSRQGQTGARVLKHDELQLNVWAERPGIDMAVQGVKNTRTQGMLPGSPGIDEQADFYIAAALREYQVTAPYSMHYAGIFAINPDGAIQAVHWTVGPSGAFTQAARNGEMQFTTVSYHERRFWESVRQQDIEAMKLDIKVHKQLGW